MQIFQYALTVALNLRTLKTIYKEYQAFYKSIQLERYRISFT